MVSIDIYVQELNQNTEKIVADIRKQRNPNIKVWVYRNEIANSKDGLLIGNWRDIKFIEDNHVIDSSITYFIWDITQFQASVLSCGLKWVISRSDQTQFCILSQSNHPFNNITMFKDAIHLEHLPEKFIKVPCFNTFSDIIEYCKIKGIFTFSLEDKNKFSDANGVDHVQGAKVYEEISTKNLWYLDMLHKTHYEVFESTGQKHIGVANLDGLLDKTKKDKKKHPIK